MNGPQNWILYGAESTIRLRDNFDTAKERIEALKALLAEFIEVWDEETWCAICKQPANLHSDECLLTRAANELTKGETK